MKRTFTYFLAALAGGILALTVHQNYLVQEPVATLPELTTSPQAHYVNLPASAIMGEAPDFVKAAENTVDAVVHVTTETMVRNQDPFSQYFWGYRMPQPQPMRGAGSGVIISDDGYIVTNNHVVEGADKIQVHMNDRRMYEATVIGRDPSTDIALLKVNGKDLPTITFGNSDDVRVGEWVLAIGNPMNLTSTVTAGIVSAKARNINLLQFDPGKDVFPIESFIQTDAAVNPGNSGGALVNTSGQLVGINTAIASMTGQYAGYSFAVPVNIVNKVTGDLLEFGSVQRAYIGVSIRDLDQALARQIGLDPIRGVYVNGLTEGGAAKEAGIRAGDVIVKVANIAVNNVPQLQEQVGKFRPGDKVMVTILRDGEERMLNMVLRGKEGSTAVAMDKVVPNISKVLGAEMTSASSEDLKALGIANGVKITSIHGGKLRSVGIREGFILTKIDSEPVRKPEDVERILGNKKGGVLIEGIYPNGMKAYYGLGL